MRAHAELLKISLIQLNQISSNFQELKQADLSGLTELQVLDLSRNNIARLGINAFSGLSNLVRLDLSLNALRTVSIRNHLDSSLLWWTLSTIPSIHFSDRGVFLRRLSQPGMDIVARQQHPPGTRLGAVSFACSATSAHRVQPDRSPFSRPLTFSCSDATDAGTLSESSQGNAIGSV